MEASVEDKTAVVTYAPTRVTTEQIEAAIEDLGYDCELLESDPSDGS